MIEYTTRRMRNMKVFISWSGSKSQEVAKALKQWIPCVIQSVEPYFSSADIDKGARWSTDIAKELQDASFGILCVTQENLNSSWLNFEAGALSKSIEQSKVCPFLIDLKPADIQNSPILQFQMTSATKDDMLKLFKSINANLGDSKLADTVLAATFDAFWPKIEESLGAISDQPISSSDDFHNVDQKTIEEILELVRYQHKLLKNPSELLPPEYIYEVVRRMDRSISHDLLREIEEYTMRISHITDSCKETCDALRDNPSETTKCTYALAEIGEYTNRIMMLIRRKRRRDYL